MIKLKCYYSKKAGNYLPFYMLKNGLILFLYLQKPKGDLQNLQWTYDLMVI